MCLYYISPCKVTENKLFWSQGDTNLPVFELFEQVNNMQPSLVSLTVFYHSVPQSMTNTQAFNLCGLS